MTLYRKKPIAVHAVQYDGHWDTILTWLDSFRYIIPFPNPPIYMQGDGSLAIDTLEGTMRAEVGDWIIRGVKGEFYPCKPDIFETSYELVDPYSDLI